MPYLSTPRSHRVLLAACLLTAGLTTTDVRADVDPIMAAALADGKAQISTRTAAQTSQNLSSVEQFVQGDFDKRQDLLTHWPGTSSEFERLLNSLQKGELYTDASGHAYRLEGDGTAGNGTLTDFMSHKIVSPAPDSLEQVTLNNNLRSVVNSVLAARQLNAPDKTTRLAAATTLAQNSLTVDTALLTTSLNTEKEPDILAILQRIKAQQDLEAPELYRQLAGAKALASSNNPEVLALLKDKLMQPNLNADLKKNLESARDAVQWRLTLSEWTGHLFTGLSMASILLLAALGLAITYGLLGVINMAHGELIMIGAYTTYVVQNVMNHYAKSFSDWYLLAAIPAAFLVSALVGMVIERVVIRPLYGRQLETLLATFGVSLILMQSVRMLFGASNVEVANPGFMSGGIALTPSLTLPFSRIAIIGFTLAVLALVKYIVSGTRFGLFVRAVTQNRQMARAIGVRSAQTDMLAFGLGSGLAGLAGCALSQVGNVGPDLGQNYIIDAFLVVVVGGVGQLMGATLAAFGLGVGGKFLEIGMGPVLAKILLLGLIILFIQKRPQGLFAVKGRFVE